MTEQPDTSWDREYLRTSQECINAAAEVAGQPSPRMLPASGVKAKDLELKCPLWTKKAVPNVETREEEA